MPSNRGPEPYFHKPPFPPKDCWVNPGILLESKLTWREDPFMYFIRAIYSPFRNMTRISMDHDSRYGIQGIYVNDPKREYKYSATFDEPQTILDVKYMVCRASNTSLALQYYFPWIQVSLCEGIQIGGLLISYSSKSMTNGLLPSHGLVLSLRKFWSRVLLGYGWARLMDLRHLMLAWSFLSVATAQRKRICNIFALSNPVKYARVRW